MHTMRTRKTRWLRALVALAVMLPTSVAAASVSCPMHHADHSKTVLSQSCCCQPHQAGSRSCEAACLSAQPESASMPVLNASAPAQIALLAESSPTPLVIDAAPAFRPAASGVEHAPPPKRYLLSCTLRR